MEYLSLYNTFLVFFHRNEPQKYWKIYIEKGTIRVFRISKRRYLGLLSKFKDSTDAAHGKMFVPADGPIIRWPDPPTTAIRHGSLLYRLPAFDSFSPVPIERDLAELVILNNGFRSSRP